MKFISIASPVLGAGQRFSGKKLVVPNQAISLQEILERFTRGEPVAVGQDVSYHESDDDLEKIQYMDLTERDEFIAQQKETQKSYAKQEKRKKAEADRKLREEAIEKLKAEEKQKGADSGAQAK